MSDLTPAVLRSARIVRWTVTAHTAAAAAQVAMGVFIVAGFPEVFGGHRTGAWAVLALALMQAISALGVSRARLGVLYTALAVAIPVMEGLQIWLGRHALTPWHVTLGLLVWAASLGLLIRVWTPGWAPAADPAAQ